MGREESVYLKKQLSHGGDRYSHTNMSQILGLYY